MSDIIESMKIAEKRRWEELAAQATQELLKLDWLKLRLRQGTLEDAIREAIDEFTYDILSHEKEMKECPMLEELLVNIARKKLEWQLPYDYNGILEQTSRDHYLSSCVLVEELITDLNTYLSDALGKVDFEELELLCLV